MPQATTEDPYKLPKDTPFKVVLNKVDEKVIPFRNKDGKDDSFTKWTWEFEILEGDKAGLKVWVDTEPRITTGESDKVRQIAETLLGRTFELGEGLDTDLLLGLQAVITVDNVERAKKDGGTSYTTPLAEIFPADALPESEAPF